MGANPVPLPGPEIFTSLQNGVVDGTGAPIFAAVTQKYYETPVKYLSLTEHIYAALLMFMSGELWDSLPAKAQDLIEQSASAAAAHQRAEAAKLDDGYLEELRNQGWEVNDVDKGLFRSAVAGVYDERPELAEWADRIRAVSPSGAVDVSLLPEVTINIGHSGAPGGYADVAAVKFKELVEERSGGRMTASQIGSERELVEGAQLGSIDAGVVFAGLLESFVPEMGVVNLPFLFDGQDHVDAVFDGPVGRDLLALAEDVDIKALAIGQFGLRSMMNSQRPIVNPDDAAAESDIYIRTYELVGANPVPLPGPEIFTSLQNGVVDGTGAPIFAAVTQKYYETPVKYLSLTEHIYAALLMFMGGELFDGLGPAAQQLVQQAAIEAAAHQRAEAAKLDDGYLEELKNQGWEVNDVNKDAFRTAVAGVYDERPELAEWADRIRAAAP
ncbi:MAG: TRAP transporter substrate-binding protein DctP [Actinomycetia bacterium]|nr:TRAP transporter substrate-binding protein DctP [Actinomycetes bacterium]